VEDLNTLNNYARQYESAADFLDQLALLSGLETETELGTREKESEMVNLSSVHQAKGLEVEGRFRHLDERRACFQAPAALKAATPSRKERRPVLCGRHPAKDELYLTYPCLRLNAAYGEMLQRPSRFLGEVPKALLEEWQINGGFLKKVTRIPHVH